MALSFNEMIFKDILHRIRIITPVQADMVI